MSCKACKATLPEEAKFCPGCGDKVHAEPDGDEETMAKATCGACETEQIATNKHCVECGGSLATPDEYAAALAAMDALAKANAALEDDLDFGQPESQTTTPEPPKTAAAATAAPDEDGNVDAFPFLDAVMKSSNAVADHVIGLGRELRALRKDQGLIAKSHLAVMNRLKGLEAENSKLREQLAALGTVRNGRLSQVTILKKSTPAAGAAEPALGGVELMRKATLAAMHHPHLLTSGEISRLETWVNAGAALDDIRQQAPALAARFEQAAARIPA